MKLIGTNLLVTVLKNNETSGLLRSANRDGGIEAEVVDRGHECSYPINIGDRIIYRPTAGVDMEIDGSKYVLISERDVIIAFSRS